MVCDSKKKSHLIFRFSQFLTLWSFECQIYWLGEEGALPETLWSQVDAQWSLAPRAGNLSVCRGWEECCPQSWAGSSRPSTLPLGSFLPGWLAGPGWGWHLLQPPLFCFLLPTKSQARFLLDPDRLLQLCNLPLNVSRLIHTTMGTRKPISLHFFFKI